MKKVRGPAFDTPKIICMYHTLIINNKNRQKLLTNASVNIKFVSSKRYWQYKSSQIQKTYNQQSKRTNQCQVNAAAEIPVPVYLQFKLWATS